MLGLGVPELLIILAIVLVIFGPGRLAGMGSAIGQSMRSFRAAVGEPSPQHAEEAVEDASTPPDGAQRAERTDGTV